MSNTKPLMQTYLVGGAVRDQLLGLPAGDRDYVVVGANVQMMLDAGYTPVGKDFPVFLHPTSHCEYALARTERKNGHGYAGFTVHASPDVTLEEDLYRRDLTINAIAQDPQGRIIDPYQGQTDLNRKVLRHVSPAFAEDPVRILRVARFAARFTDFSVAPETLQLMREMVHAGEANHLVAERVWQELSRGLMEAQPDKMFEVLDQCGALAVLLPELKALTQTGEYTQALHRVTLLCSLYPSPAPSLAARWASLCLTLPDTALLHTQMHAQLHNRLRVPLACKDLAHLAHTTYQSIHNSLALSMEDTLHLLMRCDALRKPARFNELLTVCHAHWLSTQPNGTAHYAPAQHLPPLLEAAQQVKGAAVMEGLALQGKQAQPNEIAQAMIAARVQAMSKIAPTHLTL